MLSVDQWIAEINQEMEQLSQEKRLMLFIEGLGVADGVLRERNPTGDGDVLRIVSTKSLSEVQAVLSPVGVKGELAMLMTPLQSSHAWLTPDINKREHRGADELVNLYHVPGSATAVYWSAVSGEPVAVQCQIQPHEVPSEGEYRECKGLWARLPRPDTKAGGLQVNIESKLWKVAGETLGLNKQEMAEWRGAVLDTVMSGGVLEQSMLAPLFPQASKEPAFWALLREQVTEARVRAGFTQRKFDAWQTRSSNDFEKVATELRNLLTERGVCAPLHEKTVQTYLRDRLPQGMHVIVTNRNKSTHSLSSRLHQFDVQLHGPLSQVRALALGQTYSPDGFNAYLGEPMAQGATA